MSRQRGNALTGGNSRQRGGGEAKRVRWAAQLSETATMGAPDETNGDTVTPPTRVGPRMHESRRKRAEEQLKAQSEVTEVIATPDGSAETDKSKGETTTIHQRTRPRAIVRDRLTWQQAIETGTYGANKPRCREHKLIWNPNIPG